jgi:hypothetical protein
LLRCSELSAALQQAQAESGKRTGPDQHPALGIICKWLQLWLIMS